MAARNDVRVIVLIGAGERAFCVGADLKERKTMSSVEAEQRLRDYRGAFRAIETCPQPVIAAINGYALGGGWSSRWPVIYDWSRTKRWWDSPRPGSGSSPERAGHRGYLVLSASRAQRR